MINPTIHIDDQGRRVRIGVILWTIDPEGMPRFFLRHNRPFNGHHDEWNMIFGSVEPDEAIIPAVSREVSEEAGVTLPESDVQDLGYSLEYSAFHGPTIIHFYAVKAPSIDAPIRLNEESIGYDWALIDRVEQLVPYAEQVEAFRIVERMAL